MEYRELGATGLKVSEIGFGAEWMDKPDAEVRAFVQTCQDAGINIMDVWMSDPEMRRKLGDAMAALGSRDRWIIQGHVGATWQDGQYVRTRDVEQCRPAFEELLRLLQTDHVELGMIHYVDSVAEFADIMAGGPYLDYVRQLHQAGTIQHIGLSTHNPDVALMALDHPEIEMVMFSVNPAFDMMPPSENIDDLFGDFSAANDDGVDPKRAQFYRMAEDRGVGITVMKPYAGGRLLDAEKSPFGVAMSPAQCIEYCLTRPAVASVIAGYSQLDQIGAAVAYETASAQERDYAAVLANAPMHAYFGNCIYCGHCQPCTVGINIAEVNKLADLALMQDEVPQSVREHYLSLDATASDCIACGTCEPNCPFGVHIVQRMEETAKLFGE